MFVLLVSFDGLVGFGYLLVGLFRCLFVWVFLGCLFVYNFVVDWFGLLVVS